MGEIIVVERPVFEHDMLRLGPLGTLYSLAEVSQREINRPINAINKG